MGKLNEKIAVVTGSTRGFGLAVAKAFAAEGASIVIGSRSQAAVDSTVADLNQKGFDVAGISCDVSEFDQVQSLADFAIEKFGKFDIWVNNAAITPAYGPTPHLSPEAVLKTLKIDIFGTYFGSLIAMRRFLSQGNGKLINILGMGERKPAPMQNAYGSSKAWVRYFTQALAEEYKNSGISVIAFSPGMMDTDMLLDVEVIDGFQQTLKSFPFIVQALSQPVEIPAKRMVWLASAATDHKTGLVVRELTTVGVIFRFFRQLMRRLFRTPGRELNITTKIVPSAYTDKREKGE